MSVFSKNCCSISHRLVVFHFIFDSLFCSVSRPEEFQLDSLVNKEGIIHSLKSRIFELEEEVKCIHLHMRYLLC